MPCIGDIQITVAVERKAGRSEYIRFPCRLPLDDSIGRVASAGNNGDPPCDHIDFAHAIIRIADKQISGGVESQRQRIVDHRSRRRHIVTQEGSLSVAGDRRDVSARSVDLA